MNPSFEQTLIEVWRQALVENANPVELGKERYPVRRTPKRGLRQVEGASPAVAAELPKVAGQVGSDLRAKSRIVRGGPLDYFLDLLCFIINDATLSRTPCLRLFPHIVEPPHAADRFGFRVVTGTVAQLSRLRFSRFSAGETNHLRSQGPGSTLVKKQAVWREPSSLDELPPNASRRRRRSRPSRRDAWTARWRGVGAAYADWPDGPHRWW